MRNMQIIQVEDVHRTLVQGGRELHILRGVTFTVEAGEWVALSGPSGSGKSTVARTISASQADSLIEEIRGMSIEIVDVDWELTHQAAIYKSKGGISYADCYTAALGKLRQAQVVTGDTEFHKLKEEIAISWSVN